jgi:hypothetical protein
MNNRKNRNGGGSGGGGSGSGSGGIGSGSSSSNSSAAKGLWPSYFNPWTSAIQMWPGPLGGGGRHPATPLASTGYAGRCPSLWSSTTGWAAIHATTHASIHSLWSAAGSSAFGSSDMIPMDGLVESTVASQLLQHHDHGPSCGHQLGGRLQ